jgi:hypothetical protein
VGFLAFFGLAITLLGFAVRFAVAGLAAFTTAISLTSPAASAYAKTNVAPAAKYTDQFQNPALKIAGRSNSMLPILNFRPLDEVHFESPEWGFRAFSSFLEKIKSSAL